MANRLAFQTQLASIMEVLANTAVAEICKLVDDDYAVVSLQMSQCQRENKVLKRKLRLLELKMARGNAERRLRESAANNGRPRVQINSGDSLRKSSLTTSAVFERPVDVVLWSSRGDAGNEESQVVLSEHIQSKSPDVELVEPEAVLVKEEKIEPNMSHITEPEEHVPLLGDNGVPEHLPSGSAGQGPSYEQQNSQTQAQNQTPSSKRRRTGSNSGRGVEKEEEPDVVLVKVEEVELATGTRSQTGFSIQEGVVESSTDDYRGMLPFDETTQPSTGQLQESGGGFSEPAAPQVTLTLTEDPSSIGAVQLRVPDTNTPANCNAQHQSQRSINSSSATSQYSLFELETFFTRWAPDNESVSAPGGPACSFSPDDSVDSDHDGVIMLENEPSASSAGRISGGHSTVHTQPTQALSARTSTSTSVPTKMQAPLSQQLWSRTPAMIRGAQAELQQQQHSSLSTQSAAALTNSADKTGASRISPVCRTMISIAAPQSAFPVRGSTVVLASNESAITGQHGANLLAHHSKNQIAITVTGERRKKSHICRACGKAFTGLSNLEAHERVHTGEKPFRCDTCGKHFSEAGNLKKHQRVHTGEKPFSCAQCGKRFAWICNLRTHQQSATGCAGQVMGGLGESSSHTVDHGQEC